MLDSGYFYATNFWIIFSSLLTLKFILNNVCFQMQLIEIIKTLILLFILPVIHLKFMPMPQRDCSAAYCYSFWHYEQTLLKNRVNKIVCETQKLFP